MLTKISVVRCSRISSIKPVVDFVPLLVRADDTQLGPRQLDCQVAFAAWPTSIIGSRRLPAAIGCRLRADEKIRPSARSAFAWPTGRSAAARRPHRLSSRSSDRARCEPRLLPTIAWISSTITVSDVAERLPALGSRQHQVERFGRRDERCGGRRTSAARCDEVVSPVRKPTRMSSGPNPSPRPARRSRQWHLEVAVHVVGEGPQRRDVNDADLVVERPASDCSNSRSMHARNAASVLPLPVGAAISVCLPAAIEGQPCAWASVGAENRERNQLGNDRMETG